MNPIAYGQVRSVFRWPSIVCPRFSCNLHVYHRLAVWYAGNARDAGDAAGICPVRFLCLTQKTLAPELGMGVSAKRQKIFSEKLDFGGGTLGWGTLSSPQGWVLILTF